MIGRSAGARTPSYHLKQLPMEDTLMDEASPYHARASRRGIGRWLTTGLLLGVALLAGSPAARAVETTTYMLTDVQGTVIMTEDAHGVTTSQQDYRPYGKPNGSVGPDGPGYTGHVNDPGTGLVYMQARYYDPEVGRFLSVDPVGLVSGNGFNFNRYIYANNNSVRYMDPDGRCPDACVVEVSMGAVYVVASVLVLAGACKVSCGKIKDGIEHGAV